MKGPITKIHNVTSCLRATQLLLPVPLQRDILWHLLAQQISIQLGKRDRAHGAVLGNEDRRHSWENKTAMFIQVIHHPAPRIIDVVTHLTLRIATDIVIFRLMRVPEDKGALPAVCLPWQHVFADVFHDRRVQTARQAFVPGATGMVLLAETTAVLKEQPPHQNRPQLIRLSVIIPGMFSR